MMYRGRVISHVQAQSNAYIPQGIHFDGQTGLVTASALLTANISQVSFAGWFNIAPPSGNNNAIEFSQGNGGNKLFKDVAVPAPTWCHMMGTIDAAYGGTGIIALAINNIAATGGIGTGGTVPFSTAPTNGKLVTIGTDTLGNFFTGDVADLSIWFDTSWVVDGSVPSDTIAKFIFVDTNKGITSITPIFPSSYVFGIPFGGRRPDIFLSGPASAALNPHLPTGQTITGPLSLQLLSGALRNSFTNPTKVVLTPA